MKLLHNLFLLLAACVVAAEDMVMFFPNGDRPVDSAGTQLTFSSVTSASSWTQVMEELKTKPGHPVTLEDAVGTIRVFDSMGREVTEPSHVRAGDEYFLVRKDKQWMWPVRDHGHRIEFSRDDVPPATDSSPALVLESVNFAPKVFFIHNLLSEDESSELIEHGASNVKRSTVGSVDIRETPGRTSEGTFESEIPSAKAIIKRVFKLLRVPYKHSRVDGLQIVRYNQSKFYNEHYDYLDDTNATPDNSLDHKTGGTNRYATVFFYLNDVPAGGQTGFTTTDLLSDEALAKLSPSLQTALSSHLDDFDGSAVNESLRMEQRMIKTCYSKLAVKPVKLGAVLFYNTDADLVFDQLTHHTGCPVLDGVKWGANLWVWDDNKDGKGVPASIDLTIHNLDPREIPMTAYWIPVNENEPRMVIGTVAFGESFKTTTYQRHVFEFDFADGKVPESFTVDFKKGLNQSIGVPLKGQQPIHREVSIEYMNDMDEHVNLYWYNAQVKSEVFQTEVMSTMSSNQNTFHSHEFRARTLDGTLVFTTTVDGSLGANQKVKMTKEFGSTVEPTHSDL